MKNSPTLNLGSIGKAVSGFLYRFHFVLFITTALGGLAVVILALGQTLTQASDTSLADPVRLVPFERQTIEALNQLNTSPSDTHELELPSGRTNPFSE